MPRPPQRRDTAIGNRHEARRWALQFLFQSEFNREETVDESFRLFWEHQENEMAADGKPASSAPTKSAPPRQPARQFAEELARGVIAHHEEIDALIAQHAENWDISRMGTVERNAMRLAVFEMTRRNDIPPVVSINEAVELAKAFSSTESGKFVNGILDRIRKGINRPARSPGPPST